MRGTLLGVLEIWMNVFFGYIGDPPSGKPTYSFFLPSTHRSGAGRICRNSFTYSKVPEEELKQRSHLEFACSRQVRLCA